MDNSKAAEEQGENHQQQLRRQSSTDMKAPEERPYRRRIKPPPAKVHHIHPARFRRFVQRRTCCYGFMPSQPNGDVTTLPDSNPDDDNDAALTPTSATASSLLQPPAAADAAAAATDGGRDPATSDAAAGCLVGATRESMQEAYLAWCSSNDLPLSPGTMSELPFTDRHPFSNDQR
ncbi:hypothetical protein PVAP13_9NG361914 [Panicum virgatum]|uniref:VQ domain-containing protein n=1 Tax=Panicum virgatum TaxID=38727 RepID=A0A8T0MPK9_PANVG|nr:hypothetical protein PVAP13_9NG361914 [Panicum virgatum]